MDGTPGIDGSNGTDGAAGFPGNEVGIYTYIRTIISLF